jgi:hypothetical protein
MSRELEITIAELEGELAEALLEIEELRKENRELLALLEGEEAFASGEDF